MDLLRHEVHFVEQSERLAESEPTINGVSSEIRPAKGRIKTYEELDGAKGREVFFRPQRFTALELSPLRGTVALQATERECEIHNLSPSGVAFLWPAGDVRPQGALRVSVCFGEHLAYQGEVEVASVREISEGTLVGVSFTDFLLDIDDVLRLRDMIAWRGSLSAAEKPWAMRGAHRFQALVSELRIFLEDAELQLGELERTLPWNVVKGGPSLAHTALIGRIHTEFAGDVVRYTEEIDAALRDIPEASHAAAQEYSIRNLHPLLMQSPWMHRARYKPFGYPGDFEVMNFVYERNFEGPTLFAKALSYAFLRTKAALAVKCRKDLMKRELCALIERNAGSSRPVRILSIAAGPAQELYELLTEMKELSVPLEIVLFDQDKNALGHAYRRLKPLVSAASPAKASVVFLNESIKRLLRDAHLFDKFEKFDAIYSCGLFDYLQPVTAVRLARNLFSATAPGGAVFIANMVDHDGRWFMEQHLDWKLLYRSRAELLDIGTRAAPTAAKIQIVEEATGINPFVQMIRGPTTEP